jgi:hypothetical protein
MCGPDSRPSEDEIDESKTKRSQESMDFIGTWFRKDGRRVECNDVVSLDDSHDWRGNSLPHICCAIITTSEA